MQSNEMTMETMWGLPEVFDIIDAEEELNSAAHSRMQSTEADRAEPQVELELVPGHPDWRKVTKDDTVYFFNIVTRETTWHLDE